MGGLYGAHWKEAYCGKGGDEATCARFLEDHRKLPIHVPEKSYDSAHGPAHIMMGNCMGICIGSCRMNSALCTRPAGCARAGRAERVECVRSGNVQACGLGGACSSSSCSVGRRASSNCSSRPSAGCSRALRSSESSASAAYAMAGVAATSKLNGWGGGQESGCIPLRA